MRLIRSLEPATGREIHDRRGRSDYDLTHRGPLSKLVSRGVPGFEVASGEGTAEAATTRVECRMFCGMYGSYRDH